MNEKAYQVFGTGQEYGNATEFLASLECELEGLKQAPAVIAGFQGKPDHSLRNNGFEYVSIKANPRDVVVKNFRELHNNLAFHEKQDPFHPRTSTHVHVNVSNLTIKDIRKMMLLYALFEEFFFKMVKPNRRDNIHCVPLTETYLPKDYHKSLEWLLGRWHKYTAFNMKPIVNFGSIEFRHLHGTGDAEEVNTWLHVIENLWKLCQRVEVDQATLMDKSQIESWFDLIFFPSEKIMTLRSSMHNIIRNNLIDVKFSTL
jgi:hypothetical protein